MSDMSDYLENQLALHIFENTAFSIATPATLDVQLSSTLPTDSSFTEIGVGAYAKQNVAPAGWNTPASATEPYTINNVNNIDFPVATAAYTVNGVGIFPVGSANRYFQKALGSPKSIAINDQVRIPATTGLTITLA